MKKTTVLMTWAIISTIGFIISLITWNPTPDYQDVAPYLSVNVSSNGSNTSGSENNSVALERTSSAVLAGETGKIDLNYHEINDFDGKLIFKLNGLRYIIKSSPSVIFYSSTTNTKAKYAKIEFFNGTTLSSKVTNKAFFMTSELPNVDVKELSLLDAKKKVILTEHFSAF